MKRILLMLFVAFSSLQMFADKTFRYSYNGFNLNYEIIYERDDIKRCAVSYAVNIYDGNEDGVLTIPSVAKNGDTEYTVVAIKTGALSNYYNSPTADIEHMTSVIIPSTVKTIGEAAFHHCQNLQSVTIPNNSVTEIGKDAFYGCGKLKSVTIPNSVTNIGEDAFIYCDGLTEIVYNAENCVFNTNSGWQTSIIPSSLEKISFGDNVKNIQKDLFENCSNLTEVDVPSIESWIKINFENETANPTYFAKKLLVNGETIRRMTIPEETKTIKPYSFINCESLLTVTFPASLDSIGNMAFSGCASIQRFIFPDVETYLGLNYCDESARPNYYNSEIYINSEPYKPSEVDWPSNLTKIPDYVFCGNRYLTSINIPETVTEIGTKAFFSCRNLKSVTIPNSVTEIGEDAFSYCEKLESVNIPTSITVIRAGSFCGSSLKSLTIPNSVTIIEPYAFIDCRIDTLTMPKSIIEIGECAFSETNYFYYEGHIENLNIEDIRSWSQIKFADVGANPLTNSQKFIVNGTLIHKHFDLDIDNDNISDYAFYHVESRGFGLSSLETIRVKCNKIGSYAFYDNWTVEDICLDVDSIGEQSFAKCVNLKAIYCITPEPPVALDNAFSKYKGVTLYVPIGSKSKYENAEKCWWRFLDIIETDFADIDAIFKPDYDPDGVESVFDDNANPNIDFSSPLEVYTLDGVRIADSIEGLTPGLYIVRQGNRSRKIAIK